MCVLDSACLGLYPGLPVSSEAFRGSERKSARFP
jgi:hypothetical protein